MSYNSKCIQCHWAEHLNGTFYAVSILPQWRKNCQEEKKWVNMLSQRSQTQKAHTLQFHLYEILKKAKLQWQKAERLPGVKRWNEKEHEGNCRGDGNALYFDCEGYTTNVKTHQTIYFNFKLMNSIACNLFLNKVNLKN